MTGPRADQLWNGRYRLERRLGAGGMASVWLARDERLDRDVALKVLSDVLAEDEEYLQRFRREARVAAGLNHANLVTIFDSAVAEGRPYLVMELVSGGTVAQRAAAGGLAPAEVERLAEELLAALAHIHEAGVVHRDLKPANVLIDDRDRFRLTDFGIAQPGDATSLTQTGKLIGTIRYMAPEVRAGERATVRSDLYSLGVLLRDCGGASVPALAALLDALVQEDPAGRPGSAREAASLLRVATAPTRAMPAAASDGRRHSRAPMFAAAALVVIAVVAVALAAGGGDDDESPVGDSGTPPVTDTTPAAPAAPPPETQPELEPEPAPAPEPSVPTCDELEEQKRQIDEERKAAEKAAGKDKEARKAIKEGADEQKRAIEEQKKDCVK